MRIAYFDCVGGASGDMILGALVDAGTPEQAIIDKIDALNFPNCEILSNFRTLDKAREQYFRMQKSTKEIIQKTLFLPRKRNLSFFKLRFCIFY